jgi:cysteine-rich repeat protein
LRLVSAASLAVGFFGSGAAMAQPVSVELIVKGGDQPTGAPDVVTAVSAPFTNGLGQVGFFGAAGGTHFVWVDTGIVWLGTDETTLVLSLTGTFFTMGLSDAAGFAYGPLVDGDESVWTDAGLLFRQGDAAPTYPMGSTLISVELPRMLPNGDVWFAGDVDTDLNNISNAEVIYAVPGALASAAVPVLKTGDVVGTFPLATAGIYDFIWDVSRNGMHSIAGVNMVTTTTIGDQALVVDGAIVMQEGMSTGGMDNWTAEFQVVSINDAGNHLVAGLTNAAITDDGYLAYNGTIVVRELDTLGPVTVDGVASAASLNNSGQAVFIMPDTAFEDILWSVCDASDIVNTARPVLQEGDELDFDGDAMTDATLIEFNADDAASGPDLSLGEDGWLFVEADIDDGTSVQQSILRVSVACCGDGNVGGNEACDDMMESMTCDVDCTSASCGDLQINMTAGEDCDEGGTESVTCDSDCTMPECGDGTLNMTTGEECDEGPESANCDSDCTPAVCGDGLLNMTAGEQCEDGNMVDGDGCSATCQTEGPSGAGGGATTTSSGPGSGGNAPAGAGGSGAAPTGDLVVDSGCDCKAAGSRETSRWGLAGLALLAGMAVTRRRRPR